MELLITPGNMPSWRNCGEILIFTMAHGSSGLCILSRQSLNIEKIQPLKYVIMAGNLHFQKSMWFYYTSDQANARRFISRSVLRYNWKLYCWSVLIMTCFRNIANTSASQVAAIGLDLCSFKNGVCIRGGHFAYATNWCWVVDLSRWCPANSQFIKRIYYENLLLYFPVRSQHGYAFDFLAWIRSCVHKMFLKKGHRGIQVALAVYCPLPYS